jgi:hypothetical protein
MPTSRKSTTPGSDRTRSMRLPDGAAADQGDGHQPDPVPAGVAQYMAASAASATTESTRKMTREYSPRWMPNAAPGLWM